MVAGLRFEGGEVVEGHRGVERCARGSCDVVSGKELGDGRAAEVTVLGR